MDSWGGARPSSSGSRGHRCRRGNRIAKSSSPGRRNSSRPCSSQRRQACLLGSTGYRSPTRPACRKSSRRATTGSPPSRCSMLFCCLRGGFAVSRVDAAVLSTRVLAAAADATSAEARRRSMSRKIPGRFFWVSKARSCPRKPPPEPSSRNQQRGTRPRARLFKLAPTQAYPR